MKSKEDSVPLQTVLILFVIVMVVIGLGVVIVTGVVKDSDERNSATIKESTRLSMATIEAIKVRFDKVEAQIQEIENNLNSTFTALESSSKAMGDKLYKLEVESQKPKPQPVAQPPYPKSMRINLVHYEGGKLKQKPELKPKPFKLPGGKSVKYESNP